MEPADAVGHPGRGLNVGERDWLAERFEENRNHLRAVAYRMLGSLSEADDAVQETWLRLSRSETNEVENLGGWLTTVIARVCLDVLRSRKAHREDSLEAKPEEPPAMSGAGSDPEQEAVLADCRRCPVDCARPVDTSGTARVRVARSIRYVIRRDWPNCGTHCDGGAATGESGEAKGTRRNADSPRSALGTAESRRFVFDRIARR